MRIIPVGRLKAFREQPGRGDGGAAVAYMGEGGANGGMG